MEKPVSNTLPQLNDGFLRQHPEIASSSVNRTLPERVLQFGAGVFLRGFADWMIDGMNRKGLFQGRVVVVQSTGHERAAKLNRQNGMYTQLTRGLRNGQPFEEKRVITAIQRAIDITKEFDAYLQCAHNQEIRFVISNTTEAGIVYRSEDRVTDRPPASFPAKLVLLLMERYRACQGDASKGFIFLPCELIERNGDALKRAVLQTASNWSLSSDFVTWIHKANVFTNTLVDRIVSGFPQDEAQALWQECGYKDELFNVSELFHLWVIEGAAELEKELPLREAGFNVSFVDDVEPYRERKVRILNGAHTSTVLAAYMAGKNFVGECMQDPVLSGFMEHAMYQEVIPTLALPQQELETFTASVLERFRNPFLKHALLSISLNSVAKYRARVLPSVEQYLEKTGLLPARLTFSLAALIAFYQGTEIRDGALIGHRKGEEYRIQDTAAVLEAFASLWSKFDGSRAGIDALTDAVLCREGWWGKDLRQLPGMQRAISDALESILEHGMLFSLQKLS